VASIVLEISIDASPNVVWEALRDFGALDQFAGGFIVNSRLEGDDRVIEFFDGMVTEETLVSIDDERRRLVYKIAPGAVIKHYSAAAQIFEGDGGGAKFVWTVDLLPDALAAPNSERMQQGLDAIKTTMEQRTTSSSD
jgi:uncharacterized protein YndB with AHSA1/START domain